MAQRGTERAIPTTQTARYIYNYDTTSDKPVSAAWRRISNCRVYGRHRHRHLYCAGEHSVPAFFTCATRYSYHQREKLWWRSHKWNKGNMTRHCLAQRLQTWLPTLCGAWQHACSGRARPNLCTETTDRWCNLASTLCSQQTTWVDISSDTFSTISVTSRPESWHISRS